MGVCFLWESMYICSDGDDMYVEGIYGVTYVLWICCCCDVDVVVVVIVG